MALNKKTQDQLFLKPDSIYSNSWAFDKNWIIEFEYLGKDEMDPGSKTISISTRQGLENQLYTLLHECGHMFLFKAITRCTPNAIQLQLK